MMTTGAAFGPPFCLPCDGRHGASEELWLCRPLEGLGDQQRQAAVNIAGSLFTEESHFSWAPRRTRVRLTTRDKLASVRRSALMGEYYVRRAYQRTVARHISIFR